MSRIFPLSLLLFISTVILPGLLPAQLSAPRPEAVYGGRIRAMSAISIAPDSSRLFISTESANSIFYADVYVSSTGSALVDTFAVIPALSDTAGYGNNIEKLQAHAASRTLWFAHLNQLYRSHAGATVNTPIAGPGVNDFLVVGDYLLYLENNELHIGNLDVSGNFIPDPFSPIVLPPFGGRPRLGVNPITKEVFLFSEGSAPGLYHLAEAYDGLTGTVSFTDVSPSGLSSSIPWSAFGIAPDGTLFIAGSDVHSKHLASSVHPDSAWSSYDTGMFGAAGSNLSFSGDSSLYWMYFGSNYNDQKGQAGNWHNLGDMGFETHPNDGSIQVDPTNFNIVYLTTDQGIGASEDRGRTLYEINEGVEAVQVKDIDMTVDKQTAWIASKSGIRKVSTYRTNPSWTPAIFPNGDGSPYFAVAMSPNDTNDVYVGNIRVYHSIDGGTTWNKQFAATEPPFNFPAFATPTQGASRITCLEIAPWDDQTIFAGYAIEREDEGGLFWSGDGGSTWDQILMDASSSGYDVDVEDVVFNIEGSDTVAYVGVSYDLSSPAGRSVYRLVKSGAGWTASQDMDASGTSTGSLIVATIRDVSLSWTGDTVFACGTDAGTNHPIAYYKPLNSTGLWTPFTTSGFPFMPGKEGLSITLGVDTVYVAVDNEVFFHEIGSAGWLLGYTYPVGTEINFLYFDELLVGTSTGLYGHVGVGENTTSVSAAKADEGIRVFPNPANESVTISLGEVGKELHTVSIYQIDGRVMAEEIIRTPTLELDLSGWTPGLYLVKVQGTDTTHTTTLRVY